MLDRRAAMSPSPDRFHTLESKIDSLKGNAA